MSEIVGIPVIVVWPDDATDATRAGNGKVLSASIETGKETFALRLKDLVHRVAFAKSDVEGVDMPTGFYVIDSRGRGVTRWADGDGSFVATMKDYVGNAYELMNAGYIKIVLLPASRTAPNGSNWTIKDEAGNERQTEIVAAADIPGESLLMQRIRIAMQPVYSKQDLRGLVTLIQNAIDANTGEALCWTAVCDQRAQRVDLWATALGTATLPDFLDNGYASGSTAAAIYLRSLWQCTATLDELTT